MFGSLFFRCFFVTVVMVGSINVGTFFGFCHSVGLAWLFFAVEHFYRVFTEGSFC